MYEDILVPTDGNQSMERVIDEAVDIASLCDGHIHALHAIDDSAYSVIPDDARDQVRDRLLEDGEDATSGVARRAMEADLSVSQEVRWGPPAHVVLSYAIENDVDLIIMGTHGRTGYERYLMGSVAERVVRSAPMPVMAINVNGITDAVEVIENGPRTLARRPDEGSTERDAGTGDEGEAVDDGSDTSAT